MYIFVDNYGNINEMDKNTWLNIEWMDDILMSEERMIAEIKNINKISIYLLKGKVNYMIFPVYYRGEIFYYKSKSGYILSDDFFLLANKIKVLTINNELKDYFCQKGYCPVGYTFFEEIKRFTPNSIYVFSGENITKYDIQLNASKTMNFNPKNDEENFNLFKEYLDKSIGSMVNQNMNGVLLSGGVDSRLLLVLLKEKLEHITVVSELMHPCFEENCKDVFVAKKISNLVGENINVINFDYADIHAIELDAFIEKMPFCVHSSLNFYKMCGATARQRNTTLYCGQNMDTLYNLGPTEKVRLDFHGIAQWFKRYYLSENYVKTLDNVIGNSTIQDKIISNIGIEMFKKITGQKYLFLPQTAEELIDNFMHSNDYTVFSKKSNERIISKDKWNPFDVKKKLYQVKLSYLKGGDSQAVEVAAYLNNVNVVLPYSKPMMIDYFDGLHLTQLDVWHPKRYSYRYLSEFEKKYGKDISNFSKPSKKELEREFGKYRSLYEAFSFILDKTEFGFELRQGATINEKGYTGLMRYDSILRNYWMNRILYILQRKNGVAINYERSES